MLSPSEFDINKQKEVEHRLEKLTGQVWSIIDRRQNEGYQWAFVRDEMEKLNYISSLSPVMYEALKLAIIEAGKKLEKLGWEVKISPSSSMEISWETPTSKERQPKTLWQKIIGY